MRSGQWNRRRRPMRFRGFRWDRLLLVIASAALLIFGLVKLAGYGADLIASRRTAAALREVYRSETDAPATDAPSALQTDAVPAPEPTAAPAGTAAVSPMSAASPAEPRDEVLPALPYPGNPKLQVTGRFTELRKLNRDIVGWLSIDGMLEEGVTQRDSVYYIDHDALGRSNANGAVFLDPAVSLKTRPYTLILYGHNMKSGAMFGSLRNYEKSAFYYGNPFITFNTLYEEGRYVVFAAGIVSLEEYDRHYLDLFALTGSSVRERQAALDTLKAVSANGCPVDVRPDDQLLLLVTCVDREQERRVVAARRIRDGESEAEIKKQFERTLKR